MTDTILRGRKTKRERKKDRVFSLFKKLFFFLQHQKIATKRLCETKSNEKHVLRTTKGAEDSSAQTKIENRE
jgi:hypothetical protein